MKKAVSFILVAVMVLSVIPLLGLVLPAEAAGKKITEYDLNDHVEFGWYPQSEVTYESLKAQLTAKAGSTDNWTSYNYYTSDTDDWKDGNMYPSDYMRYTDVMLNGSKYRGVYFTKYRKWFTGHTADTSTDSTYQDDNGYYINTIYWFKFEPVSWCVLDPSKGLVLSEAVLDCQAYSNYVLRSGTDAYGYSALWGDASKTCYANNYAESSIREWLNNDFYYTAFSSAQQNIIKATTLDNKAVSSEYPEYDSATTTDKIYLLSYYDAFNADYGFGSDIYDDDPARQARGTDYAKAQGGWTSSSGYTEWWFRTPGLYSSDTACTVTSGGYGDICPVYDTRGVRPAFNFDLSSVIFQSDVNNIQSDVNIITQYNPGDHVEFGWYPQSEVTDESLKAQLTAKAGSTDNWTSYNYYTSDTDTDYWSGGNMYPSDYMRYTDVMLNGSKYRGVHFTKYRDYTSQGINDYYINTIYWFKFEPVSWRVLDPANGLVLSEAALDNQAYNNYCLSSGTDAYGWDAYWGDASKTCYANNYAESSIREWLNNDFYYTAFSPAQQNIIKATTLDNKAVSSKYSEYDSATTTDKIYLLSYYDALNADYGFSSDRDDYDDDSRLARDTDYAKAQGAWTSSSDHAHWWLRTPGGDSSYACNVDSDDYVSNGCCVDGPLGVRPAFNFDLSSVIFQSKVDETFTITKQSLESSCVTLSKTSFTYNGNVQQPTVTVKNASGATLTKDTSYTVSYSTGCKLPGTYTVTITGKDNYTGTVKKTFTIAKQSLESSRVTLSKTSFIYNGSVQKPTVTVKSAQGGTMTEDSSYTIIYPSGCKYPGTYTITIIGIGSYKGTVTKTFIIEKQPLDASRVTLSKTSFTYNGNVQKPTVTVTSAAGGVMTKDASYTVTYSTGCKLPGTYTVTVTGKGSYTGTIKKTFTIKAQTIKAENVTLSKTSFTYNSAVQKPTVTVKSASGGTMTKDASYTVSYSTGCKVPGTYTVTVTGKGSYTGTIKKTFAIKPQPIKAENVTLSKTSFTYNSKVQQPTVTVKNAAGAAMTKDMSYTVTCSADSKAPGTYTVTIKGIGRYTGTIQKTYKINAQTLKAENVTLSKTSFTYNGKVQKPAVTVRNAAGNVMTNGTSYTVSYSEGCKAKGTYFVIVYGTGYYTGSIAIPFTIK